MKTYIIAEIGPNHNGSFEMAMELTERLSKIGVDAVKFQLSNPNEVLSLDAFKAEYQKNNDNAEDIFEASRRRQLTHEEHTKLARKCKDLKIDYLCTAFDLDSLKFLNEKLDIPKFKIASGEIFSLDMLEYMLNYDKPIILSTGMATFDEIRKIYSILTQKKINDITILHCVSSYPAPLELVNLKIMNTIAKEFKTKVGFSDHTLGNIGAIASVAMGACIVEKHVTLNKSLPGPDHKASATVEEFAGLVQSIRDVETVLGKDDEKTFSDIEREITKVARKSIVAKNFIKKGSIITMDDLCYRRPGTGFLPIDKESVVGKTAIQDIEENRVIREDQIQ